MGCRKCSSEKQRTFNGELAIHFPGLEGLDKSTVCVFPKLAVCLTCGFTEFTVPERELRVLLDDTSAVNEIVLTEREAPENAKPDHLKINSRMASRWSLERRN